MAAICRVLSSLCRGFIVVLLACLVGLAVPASAVAEATPAPTPTAAAGDPASAPPLAQPGDQAKSAESSAAEPSSAATSRPALAADAPEVPVPAFRLTLTIGRGSTGTLANTGVEDAASLLAFAGLLLLFGISLVALRRRR
jgi:LPXTG-motif cell wall-anchored protein